MIPTISLTRDATGFINRLLLSLLKQDLTLWFTAFVDVNLCIFPNLLSQSDVTYTQNLLTWRKSLNSSFIEINQSLVWTSIHKASKSQSANYNYYFYIHLQHWLYSYKVQKAQKNRGNCEKKRKLLGLTWN